jgi:hypothetical protein
MITWVVINRSTLRRTPKSHSLCALPRSTHVAFPFSGRLPLTVPSNSFPFKSFADPHPLNSVVSYRYKKHRGGWATSYQNPSLATHHSPLHSSPFFSHSCALFCALQNLNSFLFKRFRTLSFTKTTRGGGVLPTFNVQPSNSQTILSSHCSRTPLVQQ